MPDHAGNVVPAGEVSMKIIRGDGTEEVVTRESPTITQSQRFENAVVLGLDETCGLEQAEAGARAGKLLPLYVSSSGVTGDDNGTAGTENGVFVGVFWPTDHALAHLVGVGAGDPEATAAEARRLAYAATMHGQPTDPFVQPVAPVT